MFLSENVIFFPFRIDICLVIFYFIIIVHKIFEYYRIFERSAFERHLVVFCGNIIFTPPSYERPLVL